MVRPLASLLLALLVLGPRAGGAQDLRGPLIDPARPGSEVLPIEDLNADHPAERTPSVEASSSTKPASVLAELPLRDAIALFNAHNRIQLVLESASLGELRIGGAFNLEAPEQFASRLQTLLHLNVTSVRETIVLATQPRVDAPSPSTSASADASPQIHIAEHSSP